MAIGNNVSMKDRLIKQTTPNVNIESNVNIKNNVSKKETATGNTKKATFYVKENLLSKLYNFAYWDRRSVTEAFNAVLTDGLKGKPTKERK